MLCVASEIGCRCLIFLTKHSDYGFAYVSDCSIGVGVGLVRSHGDDGDAHVDPLKLDVEEAKKDENDHQVSTRKSPPRPFRRRR